MSIAGAAQDQPRLSDQLENPPVEVAGATEAPETPDKGPKAHEAAEDASDAGDGHRYDGYVPL